MEKRQRVFIKGAPGRGKEVIKALTDCGGYGCYTGGDKDNVIYFINHHGIIDHANIYEEIARIIMDDYYEIKLPPKKNNGGMVIYYSVRPIMSLQYSRLSTYITLINFLVIFQPVMQGI